jgi:serine/threonine protein kinase
MAQNNFLSEYEILSSSTSHEGAFATVYKVRHKGLGYIRAIRVLRETIVDESDQKYQKFLAECRLLLRLGNGGHPNIVRIAQPRLLQGHALVEMEYVHGKDLSDYIIEKNGFIPVDEVLRFVREISSALAYCHEGIYEFCIDREADGLRDDPEDGNRVLLDAATKQQLIEKYKVIHNDIHSKNIIRKYDGSFILLDFGLSIQNGTVVKSSTRKGGAAEYKAPEKWENERLITEQTDIYSLGILMYEMLAGQVPFPYNTDVPSTKAEYDLMQQHGKERPPAIEPLRRAAFETINPGTKYKKDYPDWLEAMVMKCLEKEQEKRYKNAQALFYEVERKLADSKGQADNELVKKLQTENTRLSQAVEKLQLNSAEKENEVEDLKKTLSQNDFSLQQLGLQNFEAKEKIELLEFKNQKLGDQLEEEQRKQIPEKETKHSPLFIVLTIIFAITALIAFRMYIYSESPGSGDTSVLQATVEQQASEISNLKKEKDSISMRIIPSNSSSNAEIKQLREEISRLRSQGGANSSQVSGLNQEINNLKSQLRTKDNTISVQKNEIKALKKTIGDI